DAGIVDKIKRQLTAGKTVVITSGLLRALQDKGIGDIAELRCSERRALVQDYTVSGAFRLIHGDKAVLIPQVQYLTNDSWEIASAVSGPNGWPMLHEADYSKGHLYILTIPDNFADLYNLPSEVLNKIREVLCKPLKAEIEGPGQVSLYVYDNHTCVVESFLDKETEVKLITPKQWGRITDLVTHQMIGGEVRKRGFSYIERGLQERNVYEVAVKPHSFRVFRVE
ncbi:MAG TPA: hypothetical protein VI233_02095, partial [Puia sp.]